MKNAFLILIVVIAFIFRVFAVDVIPVGFTPDEASFGYDAYSLLKTGKDQWGHIFPLVLESFGDFKPPLYAYLTAPFVGVFGLNKTAVRLPNALLGTLAVYITYLLVKELGKSSENKNQKFTINIDSDKLALISALLLAISSWHIMMSRGAFEANLTTLLMPLGVLFFLKSFSHSRFLLLSAVIFGLNLFSYHSARATTPVILFSLLILYRKDFRKSNLKYLVSSAVIFGVFVMLAFYTLLIGGATRAKDISIFSGAIQDASEQRIIAIYQGLGTKSARILHNKYEVVIQRFSSNYLQYFSPTFLFTDGPAEATYGMRPGRGVLYWFELPLVFGFIYALFTQNKKSPLFFILLWILIAPIPAALTTGRGYAANRAVIMLPAVQIALAYGAIVFDRLLRKDIPQKLLKILPLAYASVILVFFASFLEDYFLLSPYKSAQAMLYGNMEVASWLKDNSDEKDEIIMSRSLSEPQIYVAFTNKWDPNDYQRQSREWTVYKDKNLFFVDQLPEYRLGKYTFKNINYTLDQKGENSFLVGKPEEFPIDAPVVQQFNYLTGVPAVVVVQPRSDAYAHKNF